MCVCTANIFGGSAAMALVIIDFLHAEDGGCDVLRSMRGVAGWQSGGVGWVVGGVGGGFCMDISALWDASGERACCVSLGMSKINRDRTHTHRHFRQPHRHRPRRRSRARAHILKRARRALCEILMRVRCCCSARRLCRPYAHNKHHWSTTHRSASLNARAARD